MYSQLETYLCPTLYMSVFSLEKGGKIVSQQPDLRRLGCGSKAYIFHFTYVPFKVS